MHIPGRRRACPQQILLIVLSKNINAERAKRLAQPASSFRQTPGYARHRPARYTQCDLDHLHATGRAVRDEDIERLSPLTHNDITLTGRCRIALPDPLRDQAAYRPLKSAPPDAAAA